MSGVGTASKNDRLASTLDGFAGVAKNAPGIGRPGVAAILTCSVPEGIRSGASSGFSLW